MFKFLKISRLRVHMSISLILCLIFHIFMLICCYGYRIMNDFQPSCKASQNPQPSSIHVELNVVEWEVSYAPSPENIYWYVTGLFLIKSCTKLITFDCVKLDIQLLNIHGNYLYLNRSIFMPPLEWWVCF